CRTQTTSSSNFPTRFECSAAGEPPPPAALTAQRLAQDPLPFILRTRHAMSSSRGASWQGRGFINGAWTKRKGCARYWFESWHRPRHRLGLAEQGCDLMLTARDVKALEDVAQAIRAKQGKSAVRALDLREPSAAETLVEA